MQNSESNSSNRLQYTATKELSKGRILRVKIRLDDECKNGHQDFSVSGEMLIPTRKRRNETLDIVRVGNKNYELTWPGHDDIIRFTPEFSLFVDLHLSDWRGAPLYAIENGYYHLKKSGKDVVTKYLRITDQEYDELSIAEDKLHFTMILINLGIPQRWQSEANTAIAKLEELTGTKFINDSKKSQLVLPSKDELDTVRQRVNEGYYSAGAVIARNIDKQIREKNSLIEKLCKQASKQHDKIDRELKVKLFLANNDIPLDNFIYYTHTNTGKFNWHTSAYNKEITKEEFEAFIDIVENALLKDDSVLPKDIKFVLGK